MKLITTLHPRLTAEQIAIAAMALGIRLISQPDGSVVGSPINPQRQRHGTQARRAAPCHRRSRHPEPPEAA